jgi:hypothetical protein
MDLSTYSGLQAAIASYLNRADLVDQIPAFIGLAHARINRKLRINDQITRAQVTPTGTYIKLPADWSSHNTLEMTSPNVGPLLYVTPERFGELAAVPSAAKTHSYTILGGAIRLYPAPADDAVLDLTYYAKAPALTDAAPSNWLLDKAPDLYLYGALLQAEPYLMNDERVALWSAGFDGAIAELNVESERARFPQGRLQQPRRTFG